MSDNPEERPNCEFCGRPMVRFIQKGKTVWKCDRPQLDATIKAGMSPQRGRPRRVR